MRKADVPEVDLRTVGLRAADPFDPAVRFLFVVFRLAADLFADLAAGAFTDCSVVVDDSSSGIGARAVAVDESSVVARLTGG